MTTIEAYVAMFHSESTGRRWSKVFDKHGQIIRTIHPSGVIYKWPAFYTDPETTIQPRMTAEEIRGKAVFEYEVEVEFVAEPPLDIDPEFEAALKESLYSPEP